MKKPRVVIADSDLNYIFPLQLKFVEEYFDKLEIEIITDATYLNELFFSPQTIDILIISEELYDMSFQRHNISHVFVMCEQMEEEQTAELNVDRIFKYTSIREIFTEISAKCSDVLYNAGTDQKECKIVMFYSANGGTGKTLLSMAVSAYLEKNHKRVLYINAANLQMFEYLLDKCSPISAIDVYSKLSQVDANAYDVIKYAIRKEIFSYLPPFKAALMSLGMDYSVYSRIASDAKKSEDFDFVVIDADPYFTQDKAELLERADKVIIVTKQDYGSVNAANHLATNINDLNSEKYVFICNDFEKDESNALISPKISLKFSITDYITHFRNIDGLTLNDLCKDSGIQRMGFLLM